VHSVRRLSLKLGLLVVAAIVIVFVAESAAFHIVGRNGWVVGGPIPGGESHLESWIDRFGRMPATTDDGMVLAPLMPPSDSALDAREWYRAEDAAGPEPFEAANGLIFYSIGAEPKIPHLSPIFYLIWAINASRGDNHLDSWMPIVTGAAYVSSEGELWCSMIVRVPYFFSSREYVGSVDEFAPLPSAKGWRTTQIHPFLLAHNVSVLLLLFGWPFFIGDARAAIRRWRSRREERRLGKKKRIKRLPRPITLRAIGVRLIVLVIGAGALVYAIDSIVFLFLTKDGPAIVISTVTEEDEAWWKANLGELPPKSMGLFHSPSAFEARSGTWLHPRGGHGGRGGDIYSQHFPQSLVAHTIHPHPDRSEYWPLRGRVLTGADGRIAYRLGSPLPFDIRERVYMTSIGEEFVPNPVDERWQVRFRPLGYLANAALYFLVLGLPIYLRDARATLRIARGRCTSCGYPLRDLPGPRCPECGCALVGSSDSKRCRSERP
jgi:hypothetical protein